VYWKSAHISDARKLVSFSKIGGITLILFSVHVRSRTAAARIPRNTMSFFGVHARIYVVVKFSSKICETRAYTKVMISG
jgi:hypothetical protein